MLTEKSRKHTYVYNTKHVEFQTSGLCWKAQYSLTFNIHYFSLIFSVTRGISL